MHGYGPSSYGDSFADVYDEWYEGVSDVAATVTSIAGLANGGPVLELGVGTGRLAVPLAEAGAAGTAGTADAMEVHGIDTSAAMLDRLRAKDPHRRVATYLGDMVDDLPAGPFTVVFVAYNSLFNLTEPTRQRACFAAVAERLVPGGRFVVEAFVPDDPPRVGSEVTVRSLTADRVVLSVSMHRPDDRVAEGQFVELSAEGGVRMRPWMIRYASPAELDDMAAAAGFELEHRWRGFDDHSFDPDDERHVSIYRHGSPSTGG
ncbi:class I SAM-dependent methyltransferase [soil metagenome]